MRRAILGVVLGLAAPLAGAQDPEPGLEDLLQILQEETAVATRTRMNGDFVPGIVTVLSGDELLALGVQDVWEALSLVPGLQAVRGVDGIPSVITRGIDFPFNSGNLKMLVDGVPLSRENAGQHGILLLLPVQQVERIEVIRGPGSVVHGDFAFMGLVNVITRGKGSRAWVRGGADVVAAGASSAFRGAGWDLVLGAAGSRDDEAPVAQPFQISEDRAFASLQARRGGFTLLGLLMTRDADPGNDAARAAATGSGTQRHWAAEARYARPVQGAEAQARLGVRHNSYSALFDFEGPVLELGLDVSGSIGARQHWLAGVAWQRSSIDRATFRYPPPPGSNVPREVSLNLSGEHRQVSSVLAQHRLDLSDTVAATAGVRFDHDQDVGGRFTPRLAVVFRLSERHVLKAQHAEGFRPPTFFELYATGRAAEGLDHEVNATSELNYVFRRPRSVARATAFRTRLRDMIYPSGVGMFSNSREARARGLELEWEQQVGSRLRLRANASFVDEEETRNTRATLSRGVAAASFLANLAAVVRPTTRTTLSARLNHVGERQTPAALAGWDVLDVAGSVEGAPWPWLTLRAGLHNVTDEDVRYVLSLPTQVRALAYPGRTAWVQLEWNRP
jgi:outer membrane receptor for ferrienterochelin and colicins